MKTNGIPVHRLLMKFKRQLIEVNGSLPSISETRHQLAKRWWFHVRKLFFQKSFAATVSLRDGVSSADSESQCPTVDSAGSSSVGSSLRAFVLTGAQGCSPLNVYDDMEFFYRYPEWRQNLPAPRVELDRPNSLLNPICNRSFISVSDLCADPRSSTARPWSKRYVTDLPEPFLLQHSTPSDEQSMKSYTTSVIARMVERCETDRYSSLRQRITSHRALSQNAERVDEKMQKLLFGLCK